MSLLGKEAGKGHTLVLVLIPELVASKALTLDYLGELIQSPQGDGHGTEYRCYTDYSRDTVGSKVSGSSYGVIDDTGCTSRE